MELINLDKMDYAEHMHKNLELCKNDDVLFHAIQSSRKDTKIYPEIEPLSYPNRNKGTTKVVLSSKTSFEAAKEYAGKQLKVAVLNFANAKYPGGGCLNGARAQEESLCRCSTLYESLISESNRKNFYSKHKSDGWGTSDIIYTPNVVVIGTDAEFYPAEERFMVDIITCAAPNLSGIRVNGRKTRKHDARVMYKRINRIFKVAIKSNVDVLILGAFGCGVFNNPPDIVARIMFDCCKRYDDLINVVEMAVYDPSTEKKNYKAFLQEYLLANYDRLLTVPDLQKGLKNG